jgi:hypothetical protein
MGFKKNWDVADIASQINTLALEINSSYNDGFTSWHCKQDLWRIKWLVDDALSRAPNFGDDETEWLKIQDQKKMWQTLKDNT